MSKVQLIRKPRNISRRNNNFENYLSADFAREMFSKEIDEETRNSLRKIALDIIPGEFDSFFKFYDDTALVTRFSLSNKKRLETDLNIEMFPGEFLGGERIKYSSRNLRSLKDRYNMMTLVQIWETYAIIS